MSTPSEIIASQTKNCSFNLQSIEKFLALMAIQQTDYDDISYKANGPFALVLRAKKNGNTDVALKVLECTDQTELQIQAMEREYAIRRQLLSSDYFMGIEKQFFLKEMNENMEQSENLNSFNDQNVYFVQQMELCQGSLQDVIEHYSKKNKDPPTEEFKESLAIQLLDAVNLLHQRQIAHGNITAQHVLVSSSYYCPILLKLCNHRFTSPEEFRNQQNLNISENEPLNYLPLLAEYQRDQLEKDLVSMGKVLLQLDCIGLNCDQPTISSTSLANLDTISTLNNLQLNQTTYLSKIAVSILTNCRDNSQSIHSILLSLLSKQKNALKIPLFSVVLKSQIEYFCLPVPSQRKYLDCLAWQICKQRKINKLSNWFNENGQRKTNLTADLLKSALSIMFEWKEFSEVYDVLGVGVGGVVFGVENLKEKRKSALKLSLCINKAETIREIGIRRICQTPFIVKFYGYKFFKDANGNEFIVYELERCKYSLTHHLELQRMYGEYTDEQKNLMAMQMIDSISVLHETHILLRNIKLESFLITENGEGQVVVKLANFRSAAQLQSKFDELKNEQLLFSQFQLEYQSSVNCIVQKHNRESPLYFAPEQWHNVDLSTYQTDSFSSGLCIFLLDNWLVCSENQFAQLLLSISLGQTERCIFQSYEMNTKAGLTRFAKQLLVFQPFQRKSLRKLTEEFTGFQKKKNGYLKDLDENTIQKQVMKLTIKDRKGLDNFQQYPRGFANLYSITLNLNKRWIENNEIKSLQNVISNLFNLQRISLDFSRCSIISLGVKELLSPLVNLNNLSSLNIDLDYSKIGDNGAQSLLSPLANLHNLSSLTLYLNYNNIGEQGAQSLLFPLTNLHNLSSLTLYLNQNKIKVQGAQSLLSPLANLHNLSSLSLNLSGNDIEDQGAQSLLSSLANLHNLSSLSLDLNYNHIEGQGAQSLLSPLANLLNLSSLNLDLVYNHIGGQGAQSLLSPLANLNNLSSLSLDLTESKIGDQGAQSLLSPLANLHNLQSLSLQLYGNYIGDQGAQSLLYPLANLHNLSSLTLNISNNNIGNQGAQSLLSPLANLHDLSRINIYIFLNQIGDQGVQSLLSPLENLHNLTRINLFLNQNKIGEQGAQSLLYSLANLYNLSSLTLSLSGNDIGNQGAQSLISPIANLHNLSSLTLDLSYSNIQQQGAQSLLSPLANLHNLSSLNLNLDNNHIKDLGAYSLFLPLSHLINNQGIIMSLRDNILTKEMEHLFQHYFKAIEFDQGSYEEIQQYN